MEKEKYLRRQLYKKSYITVIAATILTVASALLPDVMLSCILVVMEQLWLLAYLCSVFGSLVDRWNRNNFIVKGVGLSFGSAICRILLIKVDLASMTGYTLHEMNVVLAISYGVCTLAIGTMMHTMWSSGLRDCLSGKSKGIELNECGN